MDAAKKYVPSSQLIAWVQQYTKVYMEAITPTQLLNQIERMEKDVSEICDCREEDLTNKSDCEIKWCKKTNTSTIHVNETVDDGCWNISICTECAEALGIKEGDEMPKYETVERIIKSKNEVGQNDD